MARQTKRKINEPCPRCRDFGIVEITTFYEDPCPEDSMGNCVRIARVCSSNCGYHEILRDDLAAYNLGFKRAGFRGLACAVA
jgi:hypothetical protein